MKILAIETSCDETAIALVECTGHLPVPEFKVLGNALMSQIHIHKDYGGVYPMLAKREHIKNLPVVLDLALKEAEGLLATSVDGIMQHIDHIAVTTGPGLEPALWTGITFAEELAKKWNKPIIPVNHMEGHLFSFLFEREKPIEFPAIALLVSGGHTELVHLESFEKFEIIGRTRDDAVGEAFDKAARLLDLPYPGGPKISALAEIFRNRNTDFLSALSRPAGLTRSTPAVAVRDARKSVFQFPRPMINTNDFDFSYSGLKTAVLYAVKKIGELNEDTKMEIAKEFEDAALEPLVEKTKRAIEHYRARSLIVGGGVSANKRLREMLATLSEESSIDLRLPLPELSTDNAVMIAIAAYVRSLTGRAYAEAGLAAKGNLGL